MIDVHQLQVALAQRDRVADLLVSLVDHGFTGDDSESNPLLVATAAMFQRLFDARSPWASLYFALIFHGSVAQQTERPGDAELEAWRAFAAELGVALPIDRSSSIASVNVTALLKAWLASKGRALAEPAGQAHAHACNE
jgi:hypothetical protein